MKYKRFRKLQGYMSDNNRKYDNGDVYAMDFTEVEDILNELYEENKKLKEDKKILDYIKKRHNCSNCVKALESNKTMKKYYYCLKHYKKVTENEICEDYKYWR